jgi:hypothetical protein
VALHAAEIGEPPGDEINAAERGGQDCLERHLAVC